MERPLNKILRALVLFSLLLGLGSAKAASFGGTLDLNDLVYQIPYDSGFGTVQVNGALDIQRFSLGAANAGPYEVAFSPGNFDPNGTLLGFAIADHPNDTLLADPELLVGIVDGSATFGDIIEGSQWTAIWNVAPDTTTNMSQVLDGSGSPLGPFNMVAGTDYYVFAAGGSAVSTTVDYTLETTPVPEPETWGLLLLGAALLYLIRVPGSGTAVA